MESALTRDQLLANIDLYCFTGAIGSSFFPYYFWMGKAAGSRADRLRRVPARDPARAAIACQRTYTNIRRWTIMSRGGHFVAMEQQEALAAEVQASFRPLR